MKVYYRIAALLFCGLMMQQCTTEDPITEEFNPVVFSCDDANASAEIAGESWEMESVGLAVIDNSLSTTLPEGYTLQLVMKGIDGSALEINVLEFENGRTSDCMDIDKIWSTEIANNFSLTNAGNIAEGLVFNYRDPAGNSFEVRATEGENLEGFFSLTECDDEAGFISGTFSFIVESTGANLGFSCTNGVFEGICY